MNSQINIKLLKQNIVNKSEAKSGENTQKRFWDFLNRDIRFGSVISDKVKEQFYSELGSLLEAGIDIRTGLELIVENQTKAKQKSIFKAVLFNIVSGDTFSIALQKLHEFSTYEYYSIQIGEETGKLVRVLSELGDYFKKKIKQRRQIIGAITYPVIVLAVAVGAVSFMIAFVVPMFSDVFKRFGGDLPLATKMVVRLSELVKGYLGWVILTLLVVVCVAFSQRNKIGFRKATSFIILKVPYVNTLICKIYISRFANTMSLLTGSKVPILQAIRMSKKMISFYPIENSLTRVEEDILSGLPLHKGLSGFSFYPKKMIAMLKVGEDVNQLSSFFKKISDQYDEDIEYQTSILSKMLEPMIIVGLGLVVGVILIAMYLPLFKLGQTV